MSNDELHVSFYENIADFYHAIPIHLHNGVNNFAYQFKNWQELLYHEFVLQRRPGHYGGAILYMGNAPLLGGHFVVKTTGRTRGLFLLGSGGETDYNDFICGRSFDLWRVTRTCLCLGKEKKYIKFFYST